MTFGYIPSLFTLYDFHVVGHYAKCTDVLGTANVSWAFGDQGIDRPEGKTDILLTNVEHNTGDLIIMGGPAINPVADEFDRYFGITYYYDPNPYNPIFQISAEGHTITLDLDYYPSQDVCIVYLREHNNRTILLIWGYGWQGTYAGSLFMSVPQVWNAYSQEHLFLLRWNDINANGFIEFSEIHPENIPENSVSPPPPGTPYLVTPIFGNIPSLFGGFAFHVVGDQAKCTDVLGTANVSWAFGDQGIDRPEGKTDILLTAYEHSYGNLIPVGGPAINPVADECDQYFGITYYYDPNPYNPIFQIFAEGHTITLDLDYYPLRDVCIVYIGQYNNRTILLIWGYGWQGTYAGTIFMSNPANWTYYAGCHLLLLKWYDDLNPDGFIQYYEIIAEVAV